MEKIGVFGGTFNPPHLGHLHIAGSFAKEYNLSKVLIIPTYIPPHKESPLLASSEARLKMCRETFTDDFFEVSELEILRQGKSYTYDTVKELRTLYPDAQIFFLVGDDMLTSFHEWKRPKDILKLCTVVASTRCDEISVKQLKRYAEEYFPEELSAGKIKFLETKPIEISSTEIRNKIEKGEDVKDFLSAGTLKYIITGGLYNAGTQG